jgi:HD superfamily phosphohydrolase
VHLLLKWARPDTQERYLSGTVGEFFGGSGRRIRDGVWGDVPIDRAARTLLENDALSRLKGMRQLGFAAQAFPNARHTRFDHSVGVYHLTRLTLKRIIESGAYLENRDVQGALAAALLHDAARYPYAQAMEGIALPGMTSTQELSRRLIEDSQVADVLSEEWDLEPHNVFRLVARDPDAEPHSLTPTEHLVRDIIFGTLDVNALDCLIRDARGARVPYDMVDVEALVNSLKIVGYENRASLAVDEGGAGSLQSLVFCRYLMHYNVYGHHALRIPTVMFLRAVQDAAQAGTVSPEKLARQDDAGAFVMVQDSAEPESSTAVLTKRLADRRPYHRALEFDERHPSYASLIRLREDASWRRRVEEAWARYLTRYRKGTAGPFDILIDLPRKARFSMDLRLIRPASLPWERSLTDWQGLSGMTDDDMIRYHSPLHRIRVVTATGDLATSVRRHAEELFTIAEEVG